MRISDWSSDVCSSDLERLPARDQRTGEDDGYGYSATARSPDSSTEPPPAQAATPGLCATSTRPWERRKIAQEANCNARMESAQIGRASCRARVCQYVSISVVAVPLKTNIIQY